MCNFFTIISSTLQSMCFNSFWHFYALQIPNSATFVWSAPSFHVILDQKHVVSRPFLSFKNPYFQNEAKCKNFLLIMSFIIRCKFFFLFIGRELTSWPANKCLQIMVCSCALSSNFVWLLMCKWNHAFLLVAIPLEWKWQIASLPEDVP